MNDAPNEPDASGTPADKTETPYAAPETKASALPGKPRKFRWQIAAALVVLWMIGMGTSYSRHDDRTMFVMDAYMWSALLVLGLLMWWLLLSGLRWRTRLLVLAGGSVALFVTFSIFEIRETDGAMVPSFGFRWEPDPKEVAREYLKEQPKAVKASSAPMKRAAGSPLESVLTIEPTDWPRFRGPRGDGIVDASPSLLNWSNGQPDELWRHPIGEGWSSFAVIGDLAWTQEQRDSVECVVCYDAATGKELWRHETETRHSTPNGGTGPRATPTVTEEAVYALGANGHLTAHHPVTGEVFWKSNILSDADAANIDWGMAASPLVHGGLLICNPGGASGRSVIAYDRMTGDIVWSNGEYAAAYCAPRIEDIGGVPTLLLFDGQGIAGIKPENGAEEWRFPWTNMFAINVAQPILTRHGLYVGNGYDNGSVLLDLDNIDNEGKPAEIWSTKRYLKLKFNDAVLYDGHIYGLSDGIMECVNAENGEQQWKGGRYKYGQILLCGDRILVLAENGYLAVVAASPDQWNELHRMDAIEGKTWNHPVIQNGRLFVRNAAEAACFALPE